MNEKGIEFVILEMCLLRDKDIGEHKSFFWYYKANLHLVSQK